MPEKPFYWTEHLQPIAKQVWVVFALKISVSDKSIGLTFVK